MNNKNEIFNYTYSSSRQEEIEAIRRKYIEETKPKEVDKMEKLKKLDASVTNKATTVSLCVGMIFLLIMGFGMSLIMTDLGEKLGMTHIMLIGIIIGVIGMAGVIVAYPLYQYVVKKERKRIAPMILKLTDELSEK